MVVQRDSWQEALMAETAALKGLDVLQLLCDLVKAVLVECSEDSGYNLVTLRLSLAACRLLRALGVEGVVLAHD